MANKSTKVFVSGKIYWAKVVGDRSLTSNYEGDGREWAFDFEPDDTSFLKEHKLLDRLKEDAKGNIKGPFLHIKKPEFNRDGDKNEPFRIYDGTGDDDVPWDDRLIGNGSDVDVKLNIRDWGVGKKKSIYAAAIRVTDLVSYQSDEFAGMKKDKSEAKPKEKAKPKTILEELDDDLPFE